MIPVAERVRSGNRGMAAINPESLIGESACRLVVNGSMPASGVLPVIAPVRVVVLRRGYFSGASGRCRRLFATDRFCESIGVVPLIPDSGAFLRNTRLRARFRTVSGIRTVSRRKSGFGQLRDAIHDLTREPIEFVVVRTGISDSAFRALSFGLCVAVWPVLFGKRRALQAFRERSIGSITRASAPGSPGWPSRPRRTAAAAGPPPSASTGARPTPGRPWWR